MRQRLADVIGGQDGTILIIYYLLVTVLENLNPSWQKCLPLVVVNPSPRASHAPQHAHLAKGS